MNFFKNILFLGLALSCVNMQAAPFIKPTKEFAKAATALTAATFVGGSLFSYFMNNGAQPNAECMKSGLIMALFPAIGSFCATLEQKTLEKAACIWFFWQLISKS